MIVEVQNLDGTQALGRKLGALLFPGAVVALDGQLGAGKTHFTRAVAEGLGVRNPFAVTSPTFVLIQEYDARWPIYHFDAYRLPSERAFQELGVDEYFQGEGVCLVEWASRVAGAMPPELLRVQIEVLSPDARRFEFRARGAKYDALLDLLQATECGGGPVAGHG